MQQINDMVLKAKNGDEVSMDYILKYFKPKVTAICREYFLLGSDFDDILQEGMIGLYKAIMGYNISKNVSFSNFASMCIHHQIQNAVKIASSKKNQPLNNYVSINIEGKIDDEDSPKIILQSHEQNLEERSLNKERLSLLYKNIYKELTDIQYKILIMYLNGYSYTEIANKYNLTNKNVDNQIQAIKKKLRVLLKGELL